MILIFELFIVGLGMYSIIAGKFPLSTNKTILGRRARVLGLITISGLPLMLVIIWFEKILSLYLFNIQFNVIADTLFELFALGLVCFIIINTGNQLYSIQLSEVEILPEVLNCSNCKADLELEPDERKSKIFICPNCGTEYILK
jgi:hypothetical protein